LTHGNRLPSGAAVPTIRPRITFGCGKTGTAAELHLLVPFSRVFDPETVGYMLRPNLADHPVSDF